MTRPHFLQGNFSAQLQRDKFHLFNNPQGPARLNEQLEYAFDPAGNLAYRTNNGLAQQFQVNALNELTANTNGVH